jgi:hypothetical protein
MHIHQQRQAKMPAAGATQALRLFCNSLVAIILPVGSAHREHGKEQVILGFRKNNKRIIGKD